ncbi:ABC transporter ATP-binding protein [Clavibacter michiganensis]|uniref:ABC transporter ATP-binding protein n=1 Tax=Clavibacter michiganensis TaxID=28447 RepID=UPI001BE05897|nr:ABC transporter ATP-binding protein [Clavibacter michiganensis]MBT1636939.1 ABC transporter ATP-binding protein [Clavibacter michiganensis]
MLEVDAEIGYAHGAAIQRVRLLVAPGEFVLVRGPNGVGKSTLLSTVAGIRAPLAGTVTVAGRPTQSSRARHDIGYVTDPPNLFEELTPAEHLRLAMSLWRASRLPVTGMAAAAGVLEGTPELPATMLSLGQRKRLGIALAVLHGPRLRVLDEPFNGLDDASCRRLRGSIDEHLGRGGAVVCATHDVDALDRPDATVLELAAGSATVSHQASTAPSRASGPVA